MTLSVTDDLTPSTSDRVTPTDDPCLRVAQRLGARGWRVTQRRYGPRWRYVAEPQTRAHVGLVVIVKPTVHGHRAELQIRDADGVWHLSPFCDDRCQRRLCELLDVTPADLLSTEMAA